MQRFKIGSFAGGLAGMDDICNLLSIGADPTNNYKDYTDIVGQDLTTADIQAGFPTDTWTWTVMPQRDYDILLALTGQVYIRTVKQTGASGRDATNYTAILHQPTFTRREGLVVYNVELQLTGLVPA